MNQKAGQPTPKEIRGQVERGRRILPALLIPIGSNIALSLLLTGLAVSVILLIASMSREGILYFINVLTTALAPLFAVLLGIHTYYFYRESRRRKLSEQIRMQEHKFFKRIEERTHSLMQEGQRL